jgi:hypothetical protein
MNMKIPITLTIIALIAVSSISIVAATDSIGMQSTIQNVRNGLLARSFIRVNGPITQWGIAPVNGALQTQARNGTLSNGNTNQLASGTAMWTTNNSRPISSIRSKENFTYVFYTARLNNASVSLLSTSIDGINYFLNGTWKVFTTTSHVTIITNDAGEITSVHRTSDTSVMKAYGELNVTDNWSKFTLSINGIDQLSGSVSHYGIRQVQFNPFKVTDDTSNNAVTGSDVSAVIKAYGAMPGWGNYDAKMDFCGHNKIDIADLSTVACNV